MIPKPIQTTMRLLSEIMECGAGVQKVRHAAEHVPQTGLGTATRPSEVPSNTWNYQVRVRIDGSSVPKTHATRFKKAMAMLDRHLKEKMKSQGLEETPLADRRFSILLPHTEYENDPFQVLFPPQQKTHAEMKTMHDGQRLLGWFKELKDAAKGTLRHNGEGEQPVILRINVRINPSNKEKVRNLLSRMDEHLFEQNDGVPTYDQVECVQKRTEVDRHFLMFRFGNRNVAMPIFQAIQPDGGYH